MKDFDGVVFDMDGVIFDSERATMLCWLELAEKYQIPDIEGPYLACTGTTMAKTREIMLETYGPDFPYDAYAKEASEMYHARYDGGRLLTATPEEADALVDELYDMILATCNGEYSPCAERNGYYQVGIWKHGATM